MTNDRQRRRNREKARRHRERAMAGRLVVPVEISVDDAEALIRGGLLAPAETDDRPAIAKALRLLLRILGNCRGDRSR
jgi:hypothetical protein